MLGLFPLSAAPLSAPWFFLALAIPEDPPTVGPIDAALVPKSRHVVFEGSRRVVLFEGSKRVVTFDGSDNEAGA